MAQSVSVTACDSIDFKFDWIIEKYQQLNYEENIGLRRPAYIGGPSGYSGLTCSVSVKWYPYYRDEKSYFERGVGVNIIVDLTPKKFIRFVTEYEVHVVGENDEMVSKFFPEDNMETCILTKHEVETYIQDGNLTLRFEGKIHAWFIPSDPRAILPVPSTVTLGTMTTMFETGCYSDFIIKVASQEFKCHKSVLSVRSKYFRDMFESGMKENEEGIVDLSHLMNENELKGLLQFIYLGTTFNLPTKSPTLLKISHMIGLKDLCRLSEEALIREIKSSNASEMLKLASENGAKKLQKEALMILAKSIVVDY